MKCDCYILIFFHSLCLIYMRMIYNFDICGFFVKHPLILFLDFSIIISGRLFDAVMYA